MNETLNAEAVAATEMMTNAQGKKVAKHLVAPADLLKDDTVRRIMGYAEDLSGQIARFKGHTFDDIGALFDLLSEKYGETLGGPKGNMTLLSYDGLMRVELQMQQQVTYGPELQVARNLIDKCLDEWTADSNPHVRLMVQEAFQTDGAGKISLTRLLALRRHKIMEPRWQAAMKALGDSFQAIGKKAYLRFYKRESPNGAWHAVRIDLAALERQ